MENPDIPLDELMKIIPGPDFPTGGVLVKTRKSAEAMRPDARSCPCARACMWRTA